MVQIACPDRVEENGMAAQSICFHPVTYSTYRLRYRGPKKRPSADFRFRSLDSEHNLLSSKEKVVTWKDMNISGTVVSCEADLGSSAVQGVGLQLPDCWGRGFESR